MRSSARPPSAAVGAAALRAAPTSGNAERLAFELVLTDEFVEAVAARVLGMLGAQHQQHQEEEQTQWLNTKHAAEHLAVPVSHIYRAVSMRRSAKRPIPVHKDGTRNYFLAAELDEWRLNGGAA